MTYPLHFSTGVTCVSLENEWIMGCVLKIELVEICHSLSVEFVTSDWVDVEENPKSTLLFGDNSNMFVPRNEEKAKL